MTTSEKQKFQFGKKPELSGDHPVQGPLKGTTQISENAVIVDPNALIHKKRSDLRVTLPSDDPVFEVPTLPRASSYAPELPSKNPILKEELFQTLQIGFSYRIKTYKTVLKKRIATARAARDLDSVRKIEQSIANLDVTERSFDRLVKNFTDKISNIVFQPLLSEETKPKIEGALQLMNQEAIQGFLRHLEDLRVLMKLMNNEVLGHDIAYFMEGAGNINEHMLNRLEEFATLFNEADELHDKHFAKMRSNSDHLTPNLSGKIDRILTAPYHSLNPEENQQFFEHQDAISELVLDIHTRINKDDFSAENLKNSIELMLQLYFRYTKDAIHSVERDKLKKSPFNPDEKRNFQVEKSELITQIEYVLGLAAKIAGLMPFVGHARQLLLEEGAVAKTLNQSDLIPAKVVGGGEEYI